MIEIDYSLAPADLKDNLAQLFRLSGQKIESINRNYDPSQGAPVFTVEGKYTSRGWTDWTQGFQYGWEILQFDATGEQHFLEQGRKHTVGHMATHISHFGVHDHGFNIQSTYGNLLRLMAEGRMAPDEWERNFYELALKVSGAVQAARWTAIQGDLGYVYSFNGPHSLFADTIRSMRSLALSHKLGHLMMGEQDQRINLLHRMLRHMEATAQYIVFHGMGRDIYDIRGRVAHEAIFNVTNGVFRCPGTQQGYSPFSTWTRGLSWILLGYAEQLEFLATLPETHFNEVLIGTLQGKNAFISRFLDVATGVADYYISNTPADGIPYWDTGAPHLDRIPDVLNKKADPYNHFEPVDSSAASICAQGFLRLGVFLGKAGRGEEGKKYYQTGLTIARNLMEEPYLSTGSDHQGLLLHAVYHRPNGWDHMKNSVPYGESCMWGDYHLMELAVFLQREAIVKDHYLTFYTI